MSDTLNLPWKIYFFDSNGLYFPDEVMHIHSTKKFEDLMTVGRIKKHNDNKLEIRVCDSLDYCIMHFKDGKKIYPK